MNRPRNSKNKGNKPIRVPGFGDLGDNSEADNIRFTANLKEREVQSDGHPCPPHNSFIFIFCTSFTCKKLYTS